MRKLGLGTLRESFHSALFDKAGGGGGGSKKAAPDGARAPPARSTAARSRDGGGGGDGRRRCKFHPEVLLFPADDGGGCPKCRARQSNVLKTVACALQKGAEDLEGAREAGRGSVKARQPRRCDRAAEARKLAAKGKERKEAASLEEKERRKRRGGDGGSLKGKGGENDRVDDGINHGSGRRFQQKSISGVSKSKNSRRVDCDVNGRREQWQQQQQQQKQQQKRQQQTQQHKLPQRKSSRGSGKIQVSGVDGEVQRCSGQDSHDSGRQLQHSQQQQQRKLSQRQKSFSGSSKSGVGGEVQRSSGQDSHDSSRQLQPRQQPQQRKLLHRRKSSSDISKSQDEEGRERELRAQRPPRRKSSGGSSGKIKKKHRKRSQSRERRGKTWKRHYFSLGQAARPADMDVPASDADAHAKVAGLQKGDGAWVQRSGGTVWTYAIVKRRRDDSLVFVVNERGSTKTFLASLWAKGVRIAAGERTAEAVRGVGRRQSFPWEAGHAAPGDDDSSRGTESALVPDHKVSMYTLGEHRENELDPAVFQGRNLSARALADDGHPSELNVYLIRGSTNLPQGCVSEDELGISMYTLCEEMRSDATVWTAESNSSNEGCPEEETKLPVENSSIRPCIRQSSKYSPFITSESPEEETDAPCNESEFSSSTLTIYQSSSLDHGSRLTEEKKKKTEHQQPSHDDNIEDEANVLDGSFNKSRKSRVDRTAFRRMCNSIRSESLERQKHLRPPKPKDGSSRVSRPGKLVDLVYNDGDGALILDESSVSGASVDDEVRSLDEQREMEKRIRQWRRGRHAEQTLEHVGTGPSAAARLSADSGNTKNVQ